MFQRLLGFGLQPRSPLELKAVNVPFLSRIGTTTIKEKNVRVKLFDLNKNKRILLKMSSFLMPILYVTCLRRDPNHNLILTI